MKERKPGTKGGYGRFMPCPNNPFAHTEGVGAVGTEVRWSCKRTPKGDKVSTYYGCGLCKTQVFLNTWNENWGFTLPEAEAMGLTLVGLDATRKDEILKGMGLKRVPSPGMPGFPQLPPPPSYRPDPRRTGKKK